MFSVPRIAYGLFGFGASSLLQTARQADLLLEGSTGVQDFDFICYEVIDDGRIAVITLDRPKQRNAQNRGMLVELGSAFERAEEDDDVRA